MELPGDRPHHGQEGNEEHAGARPAHHARPRLPAQGDSAGERGREEDEGMPVVADEALLERDDDVARREQERRSRPQPSVAASAVPARTTRTTARARYSHSRPCSSVYWYSA